MCGKSMSIREIERELDAGHEPIRQSLSRLRSLGWVERVRVSNSRSNIFTASSDGREEKVKPPLHQRVENLRKRLTKVSQKAHEARYTGLAGSMGIALAEIEKDIIQIRDDLYVQR